MQHPRGTRHDETHDEIGPLARPVQAFISDGANLTPEDVVRVARDIPSPGGVSAGSGASTPKVDMAEEARRRVAASRAIVDSIVERGEVVYGITTGFGAFKDRLIPPDQLAQLQVNLLLSHCVGVGPALPTEVLRAMMLCRAHTLSLGYSGIRPATLQLLYDMLNVGVHPYVPEQGSLGASGDLAPLAHMALVMIGQGQAEWQGRMLPAADALRAAGLQPVQLGPKEGVALTNGTSLMSALLSLAVADAAMLCDTADVVGALSLEALQGVPAAFDPRIHAARPHNGQITSAANIRRLTQGSTLLFQTAESRTQNAEDALLPTAIRLLPSENKVQDAYSLRCMPQVHGPARDATAYVHNVLLTELNSANDNPLVFGAGPIGQGDHVAVLSGGNFHGAPLSVAADFLGIALCGLANISERRQARMVDIAAHGGLFPPFLIEHGGLNSGFMMVQYTAAALASENKSLAHPASVDTIPTSANTEDHVSMGPIAARHARSIVANTARILALEALMAAQAIDFRLRNAEFGMRNDSTSRSDSAFQIPHSALGEGSRLAYDLIRSRIPFLQHDQDMQPLIAAAIDLVTSGALASLLSEKLEIRS
jgi:histidine ammonia-lyase